MPYPERGVTGLLRGDDPSQAVINDHEIGPLPAGTSLRADPAHAGAILDAALDAVITIDHQGRVLEFNPAAERTFGYAKQDVVGRELAGLIVPPTHREAHRRALERWTEHGPTRGAGALLGRRLDVQAMRADGTEFPAELAISRVEIPGPPIFTACIRDISDRADTEERLRTAEFRYRTLVEQLPLISYVDHEHDPGSKAMYVSPQIETVLGYTPEEWLTVADLFTEAIHEDDRQRVLDEKVAAYTRGETLRQEYRMHTRDGRLIWVEDISVHVEPPEGGVPFRQGFALDITERKRADEAVRLAETRYRTLVEQLPLAVYIDRVDASSSNVYTSPQIEEMLGYSVEEWVADPSLFVELLHADDRERVLAAHERTHVEGEPLHVEYRLYRRDGRVVWVHDEAHMIKDPATGEPVLQGYLLDITARREAEEQLRHQAFHDPLTGLANRALFTDRVQHALVVSSGDAAVLFLDLDDFKAINDGLGHVAGDALLRAVGVRLRASLSATHTVARMGGDEFAILVERADAAAAALDAAERITAALQTPFDLDGREMFVTASVGIAVGGDAEELLRCSDVAMYGAKASGKAQYVVYAPRMDEHLVGRLELVADLRRADIASEFDLHYQPVVELLSGAVRGVEALVRWEHPTRGLLQPSEFVHLAEETGRIVEIGRWVLAEACRQTAEWHERLEGGHGLSVSVNVSTRQVRRPGLLDDVDAALAGSGLEPGDLTLEITESVLARRREELTSILEEVTNRGVRLALDDFGTGYSSLSLLQDLPVHTLKVDRSFVQSIGAEDGGRAPFVRAIVELAEALELTVVAEGIEEIDQVAALRRLGCRVGQGFYFARPLPPAALEAFVRENRARSAA
jgi:diguanylate cyclase (GGDEF)-like protein/PAS domain S-box-containing protein